MAGWEERYIKEHPGLNIRGDRDKIQEQGRVREKPEKQIKENTQLELDLRSGEDDGK